MEEEPERELREPEEEELGFTRRAFGASASSLKGKNTKDRFQDHKIVKVSALAAAFGGCPIHQLLKLETSSYHLGNYGLPLHPEPSRGPRRMCIPKVNPVTGALGGGPGTPHRVSTQHSPRLGVCLQRLFQGP